MNRKRTKEEKIERVVGKVILYLIKCLAATAILIGLITILGIVLNWVTVSGIRTIAFVLIAASGFAANAYKNYNKI